SRSYLDAPAAGVVQHGPDRGHLFRENDGQAAQRVHGFVYLGDAGIAYDARDVIQFGTRIDIPHAFANRHDQLDRYFVVLVLDIAVNLLHQIFDGDDAVGARELVHHDRQMHPACAHVGQYVQRAPRLRDVEWLAHQRRPVRWGSVP